MGEVRGGVEVGGWRASGVFMRGDVHLATILAPLIVARIFAVLVKWREGREVPRTKETFVIHPVIVQIWTQHCRRLSWACFFPSGGKEPDENLKGRSEGVFEDHGRIGGLGVGVLNRRWEGWYHRERRWTVNWVSNVNFVSEIAMANRGIPRRTLTQKNSVKFCLQRQCPTSLGLLDVLVIIQHERVGKRVEESGLRRSESRN